GGEGARGRGGDRRPNLPGRPVPPSPRPPVSSGLGVWILDWAGCRKIRHRIPNTPEGEVFTTGPIPGLCLRRGRHGTCSVGADSALAERVGNAPQLSRRSFFRRRGGGFLRP